MKLYSLTGATSVGRDDVGDFDADVDGAVEVPEDFGVFLRDNHPGGVKAWEDEPERHARLVAEEEARRRDPASAYDLLAQLVQAQTPAPETPVVEEYPPHDPPAASPVEDDLASESTPPASNVEVVEDDEPPHSDDTAPDGDGAVEESPSA